MTQQVFLRVFRKIEQFAGQARFATWLYRVAVNEALQYLRRRSRHGPQPLLYEPMGRHRAEHERQEIRELLDRALARLEPELRSIFLLREVEKLSYGDIAVALEIPEGTVGSRLNRARRELRQHLTDLGWEP
jgi:RNA polymerase sigma-70 factor (ECF subfamily)